MTEPVSRLWILKAKGEESTFSGNTGYADDPVAAYVYDTNVPNCNKIREGDQVIIAGKKFVKGYATITSIKVKEDVPKIVYKCPECKIHELYERKTLQPRYKCRRKHEFDVREEEQIVVKEFTAYYGSTFVLAKQATSVKILEPYYLKRNIYYSIQAADVRFFEMELGQVPTKVNSPGMRTRARQPASETDVPPYLPDTDDQRTRKNKRMVVRPGQKKFKDKLIRYYDHWCMITDCDIPEAIEASHIYPYKGEKDNNPRNGLLLRTDLHELFDSDLLGIHPEKLTIQLHPRLHNSCYSDWDGKKIIVNSDTISPSPEALQYRWKIFMSKVESFIEKN